MLARLFKATKLVRADDAPLSGRPLTYAARKQAMGRAAATLVFQLAGTRVRTSKRRVGKQQRSTFHTGFIDRTDRHDGSGIVPALMPAVAAALGHHEWNFAVVRNVRTGLHLHIGPYRSGLRSSVLLRPPRPAERRSELFAQLRTCSHDRSRCEEATTRVGLQAGSRRTSRI